MPYGYGFVVDVTFEDDSTEQITMGFVGQRAIMADTCRQAISAAMQGEHTRDWSMDVKGVSARMVPWPELDGDE